MTRSDFVLNLAVGVLTLCAVVVTGLVVRRELFPASLNGRGPETVHAWRTFGLEGHRMGPTPARITIVVFSDFQCPFCAALMNRLQVVRSEYPKDVAVVYRHFPLDIHKRAISAARASECAAAQDRFEAFSNALFASQDSIGVISWARFAISAGVRDLNAFNACNARIDPITALARDTVAGDRLGVRVTPTLLINDARLEGAQPLDSLESRIARMLHSGTQ